MKCESYEGRRTPHAEPVCLDGKIEIIKETPAKESMLNKEVEVKIDGRTYKARITEED
jgi:hypothetical protein